MDTPAGHRIEQRMSQPESQVAIGSEGPRGGSLQRTCSCPGLERRENAFTRRHSSSRPRENRERSQWEKHSCSTGSCGRGCDLKKEHSSGPRHLSQHPDPLDTQKRAFHQQPSPHTFKKQASFLMRKLGQVCFIPQDLFGTEHHGSDPSSSQHFLGPDGGGGQEDSKLLPCPKRKPAENLKVIQRQRLRETWCLYSGYTRSTEQLPKACQPFPSGWVRG